MMTIITVGFWDFSKSPEKIRSENIIRLYLTKQLFPSQDPLSRLCYSIFVLFFCAQFRYFGRDKGYNKCSAAASRLTFRLFLNLSQLYACLLYRAHTTTGLLGSSINILALIWLLRYVLHDFTSNFKEKFVDICPSLSWGFKKLQPMFVGEFLTHAGWNLPIWQICLVCHQNASNSRLRMRINLL